MKSILITLFIAVLTTSCIPNKDLVYLQKSGSKEAAISISKEGQKPYLLQSNDILAINIKALDQNLVDMFAVSSKVADNKTSPQDLYFTGFTVSLQGTIRIPVLGEIMVLGKTADEVRAIIEKRLLDEYFKQEARLFVTVKLAGLRYTINGEVGSPGTNVLYQETASIMEAIANSGDITITGNRKKVQVIRQFPYGMETYYIDLTQAAAVNSPAFYLQPNDYIYIQPLKQKSWGTGTTGVQSFTTIVSVLTIITTIVLLTRK